MAHEVLIAQEEPNPKTAPLPRWAGVLAPVLATLGSAVPLLVNRRFYYVDDSESSAFGQYWKIGERLLSWDWSMVNPTVWQSGNYVAETSWGIFSPLLWVVGLTSHLATNVPEYLTLMKLCFIAIAAIGAYKLARSFGVSRLWAVAVGALAPLCGVTKYLDGPSWANGLMGWSIMLVAWWLARRAIVQRRGLVVAVLGGFLLVGINYPHASLLYALVLLGMFAERAVCRDRRGVLRSLYVGLAALLCLLAVNLPQLLTAPVTGRSTEIANSGVMTVNLSNLAGSATGAGNPSVNLFGEFFPNAPLTYLAWILPLAALVRWSQMWPVFRSRLSLLVLAAGACVIGFGPSDIEALRFPIRLLPYVTIAALLGLAIGLTFAQVERPGRGRIAMVGVLSGVSAWFCWAAWPTSWGWILLTLSIEASALILIALILRHSRAGWRVVAVLTLGTLGVVAMQLRYPASPLREYETPTAVSAFTHQLTGLTGDTLVVGDTTSDQPEIWDSALVGNMWYVGGNRSVQNAYSTLYYPAYDAVTCMAYNGLTECPGLLPALFEEQDNLGITRADAFGVSNVVIIKSSFTREEWSELPSGWHVTSESRLVRVLSRDSPIAGAGSVVWTSDGVAVRVLHEDAMGVTFHVDSAPDSGGRVALSRVDWPGYEVSGPARIVSGVSNGLLLTVKIDPDSVGKDITVGFHLPGAPIVESAAVLFALLLLLGTPGLLLLERRQRVKRAQQE